MLDDNIKKKMADDDSKELVKPGTNVNIGGLSEISNLTEEQWKYIFRHFRIGEHMLQRKFLTITQLSEILEEQKETGEQLGELVIRKGFITRAQLLQLLQWQHKADAVITNLQIELEEKKNSENPPSNNAL